ncbi:MAG: multifunctional oxoglutarate decarboxylase/oxoglutarate dehydrogenase thiamine pyrophosphate-binding subunit/dihydrolipoyllysine-residue succinyltransferase subunit [Acidimicrobiia bacterium]
MSENNVNPQDQNESPFETFGPNSGLVEEMYRQYLGNPSSVGESWAEFFKDYTPKANRDTRSDLKTSTPQTNPTPTSKPAQTSSSSTNAPTTLEGETPQPLTGVAAKIVENMENSLSVPTATSVRAVPAKLMEVNRTIINNSLARHGGGKISFTHLIAFAVARAVEKIPAMNVGYGVDENNKPQIVNHTSLNLGLAVDIKKPDGSRTLMVPGIKNANHMTFAQFLSAYEELISKVRSNKLTMDDFSGITATVTNPGMIGTVHSVPRLMPGQGFILGVGSIDYPAEFQGADPSTMADLGVSKVLTLTSTYDHRVIQGAASGEFLQIIHQLLIGEDNFYDEIFESLKVPYEPARWNQDSRPENSSEEMFEKILHVYQLINQYRVRGHLLADIDPLGRKEIKTHPELDVLHYGLSIWDLDRTFPTGGISGKDKMPLRDILKTLRDAYSRTVGIEYMHMQTPEHKTWIQQQVEGVSWAPDAEEKSRILERLNAAEAFERFLHTKFMGHKRFSLEGAETLIPMLNELLNLATEKNIVEAVLGMAHRGRLNVLANTIGKSYGQIFKEFDGQLDNASFQGSGDVKYHLGATGTHIAPSGKSLGLTLSANPSHLEAVNPVVEGMARAKLDTMADSQRKTVLPILIHGDAAFAGQGVVAETFNLSAVAGYDVGGTVHIVINNQLGFTTSPVSGRSGTYATDVAKMVQAPIFHVNGDDPEACVRVVKLALEFRQKFGKDVVVDMICYRRYGHNETDEPAYTQPIMYSLIDQHRSVRKLYTETLINRGDITLEQAQAALDDFKSRLEVAFEDTRGSTPPLKPAERRVSEDSYIFDTKVSKPILEKISNQLSTWPEDFSVHPKLVKIVSKHKQDFEAGNVEWATAELLSLGSLLLDGVPIRMTGQDTRRGTFSQRHAVLVDHENENDYTPLKNLDPKQAPFEIYDSVLSEFAALGFEYGYSVSAPNALTIWEAQFGDFANGAQTIIDQFISVADDKWGQRSRLVMLLPHGYEGQGPEHSSARIERFLCLCAEHNMRVAYPTTAAQYFHLIRRQMAEKRVQPLVVFTPKKYLRMPSVKSSIDELTNGYFHPVLSDDQVENPTAVKRVVFCTGKIAHELRERRNNEKLPSAIVRIEELFPFPKELIRRELEKYPNADEFIWTQEEPANMGAGSYIRRKLKKCTPTDKLHFVARPASASPATGSATIHEIEQEELIKEALY